MTAGASGPAGFVGSAHLTSFREDWEYMWHERLCLLAAPPGVCSPGSVVAAWVLCPDGRCLKESVEAEPTEVAGIIPLTALGELPAGMLLPALVNRFKALPSAAALWAAIEEGVRATGWPCPVPPFAVCASVPGPLCHVVLF